MNYLAHAYQYLNQPLFMSGTGVPDMLSVVDRRVRVRSRNLRPLIQSSELEVVEIATGIQQHLDDDRWFHATQVFNQLNLEFAQKMREADPEDSSLRPRFLGHIIIELLIDARLAEMHPGLLDRYYDVLEQVDAAKIQRVINMASACQTDQFVRFFEAFCREKFLYDYLEDDRLAYRLNQVMKRVGLPMFGDSVIELFPSIRRRVYECHDELLTAEVETK
ncbi:MAG: hypothetical protein VX776_02545 [Planctomycetota bacterium]|nr:hypothetical protein [Planctomycetota bacterium]